MVKYVLHPRLLLGTIFFFVYLCLPVHAVETTDEAQHLYQNLHSSVVQVQVVDLSTGKKTSIGSGFQFSPEGYLATNFHVVSEVIHSPRRFRVESIRHDGTIDPIRILDVDVVHDLAICKIANAPKEYIPLGKSDLSKGTRLFSMGNPFDLGMTIVEGIYNGLMEDSLYKKILFSGSLNPGMSGGPALNHEGEAVGVNVSTAGNEVSFVVPVEYLKELYAKLPKEDVPAAEGWEKRIQRQLTQNQDHYIHDLLSSPWDTVDVGEAKVPGEVLKAFKCWSKSEDKDDELYKYAYVNCSTSDNIFLSSDFSTGQILYQYYWLASKGLNAIRFYNLYEKYFQYPYAFDNAGEDDVTNFKCENDFLNVDKRDVKVLWCARNYKKYPELYDIDLALALVDQSDRGLLAEVIALGVGKQNAMDFVRKFLQEIKWKKSLLR